MRKNEDPRLSFSTPEFKEAQRMFTDNLKVWTLQLCTSAPKLAVGQHNNALAVAPHDRKLCIAKTGLALVVLGTWRLLVRVQY